MWTLIKLVFLGVLIYTIIDVIRMFCMSDEELFDSLAKQKLKSLQSSSSERKSNNSVDESPYWPFWYEDYNDFDD